MLYLNPPNAFTLHLGPGKVEMLVDPNHLARTSNRFKALLAVGFPEGQPRSFSLPSITYGSMSLYTQFINSGTFPTTDRIRAGRTPIPIVRNSIYDLLATLYFVGLKLEDRTCSNAVMREILRIFDLCRSAAGGGVPGRRTVQIIYESVPPSDVGRRLLVDMYTNFGSARQLYTQDGAFNAIFLQDLAQELLRKATENKAPDSYRQQPLDPTDYMV